MEKALVFSAWGVYVVKFAQLITWGVAKQRQNRHKRTTHASKGYTPASARAVLNQIGCAARCVLIHGMVIWEGSDICPPNGAGNIKSAQIVILIPPKQRGTVSKETIPVSYVYEIYHGIVLLGGSRCNNLEQDQEHRQNPHERSKIRPEKRQYTVKNLNCSQPNGARLRQQYFSST